MLSASDLTAMQAQQAQAQPETCVVSRRTLASDGAGGQTETWAAVATTTARLTHAGQFSRGEQLLAERLGVRYAVIVTLSVDMDVRVTDRLILGDRTLEVMGAPMGSWATARRVMAEELK